MHFFSILDSINHRFTGHWGVIFVVLILLCQTTEEVDTSGGAGWRVSNVGK